MKAPSLDRAIRRRLGEVLWLAPGYVMERRRVRLGACSVRPMLSPRLSPYPVGEQLTFLQEYFFALADQLVKAPQLPR